MRPSSHHRFRRLLATLVLLVAAATSTAACGDDDPPLPVSDPTLPPPPDTVGQPAVPGPPGQLVSAEPMDPATAPSGGVGWRIVYWSTTAGGEPVVVTGQVTAPSGVPPEGGWPTVAWGHPTVGTSDRCTPSLEGSSQIHLANEFTEAGIAVAATDYEGLGTEGSHPYLVGASAGHNVLDAARAATQIEGSGVAATSPVVIAGFSQGGHAALWAAEVAPDYAPDLDVVGVFAASPVSSVTAFAERAAKAGPFQTGVLVTIVYGLSQTYPELDLRDVLTQESIDRLSILEDYCIGEAVAGFGQELDVVFAENPLHVDAWRARLDENGAGQRPLDVPVRVLQGRDDLIVFENVTAATVDDMCKLGDTVEYAVIDGADHAVVTADRVLPWIEARFRGEPAPDTCGSS